MQEPPIFMHVINQNPTFLSSTLPRKILKSWVGNVKSCDVCCSYLSSTFFKSLAEKIDEVTRHQFSDFLDISFCVWIDHNFSNLMYFQKRVKYVRETS